MIGSGGYMLVSIFISAIFIIGFAYIIWVLAAKEENWIKLVGQIIAAILILVALWILLYGGVYGGIMGKGSMGCGKGMGMGMMGKGKMMGSGMMGKGMKSGATESYMKMCVEKWSKDPAMKKMMEEMMKNSK